MVAGQYLGIAALFMLSMVAAVLAWSVPPELLAWLGLLPVLYGISMLVHPDSGTGSSPVPPATGTLAIASVTIANGSDNLGTYIPLFANSSAGELGGMATVFAVMTALWCLLARWLARHPRAGATVRQFGPKAVPWVLVGIGLWILLR